MTMRGGFGAVFGRVGFFFFVLVACVQIALTAPASAQQPTASDFTVTAPYGSTRIDYSFAGHATGGTYRVDTDDYSPLGPSSSALMVSSDPAFYVFFQSPGFIGAGTVRYWTCTSYQQCTGADRADGTITFVPTGAPTPVVTSVAVPVNGSYRAGDPLQFTVNFDLDVTVTGTPRIALNVGGGPRYADYVSGSGTSALVFTHTVQPGDMALSGIAVTGLSANGGTIRTAAQIDANLALNNIASTAGVLVDTTPPKPTANDFTVTAPYGTTRIDYSFAGHATGGRYQVNGSAIFPWGNIKTVLTGSTDPDEFYVDFHNPGFVRAGTAPYWTCTSQQQCTGADRADGTITFVPTGAPTPTVTSVAVPANGTYKAGDPLQFTVNFDRDVTVTGTPQIALTVGTVTRTADYVSGSGSSALVFRYSVQAGDLAPNGVVVGTLSANGGMIRSVAYANANLALNNTGNTSGVLVDTTSPEVQAVSVVGSPPSDVGNVTLEIVFSKPVTGFAVGSITPLPPAGGSAALTNLRTSDNITYQVDFGMTVPGTYGIQIAAGSVTDAAGNGNVAYTNNSVWVRFSDDASLSSIVSSAGALSPVFAPGTLNYTLAVDHDTETLTLTPLVSNSDATVTVDGQAVASGNASQPVPLLVGANVITILVTAHDGTSTQTYTVTATRAPSGDVRLTGLATSAGTIDPAFAPTVLGYGLNVGHEVDSLSVTPTVAEATATVTVNGQAVASGSASQPVALAVGATPIRIDVTAADGTVLSYLLTVNRLAASNASLAALSIGAGALEPAFSPGTSNYTVNLDHDTESLTFTPAVADTNATVTVNGQAVASGTPGQALPLAVGTNAVSIVVTAQDGMSTQTYTVTIVRAGSANANLAGLLLSAGTLEPAFAPGTRAYSVTVDHGVEMLTLTPTAAHANAAITIAGQPAASGAASQPVPLAIGRTQSP
ncbi:cadherin-like beta sandwich domain-containing protein [Mesorhizobium sp. SB112]|uniref:cadherin-like beta sandwich domain-containing protein n=1 Tax=Mesorhizobium sp. SB112 TaxID=3151853 RepID=UPI003267B3DE